MSHQPSSAPRVSLVDPRTLARVTTRDEDGVTVAEITGEVDISNVESVGRVLTQVSNQASGLVVDLREATYLDSSAISLLHDLASRLTQRSQRLTIVCGAQSLPRRVLTVTGLDARAPVFEELAQAVAAAASLDEEGG